MLVRQIEGSRIDLQNTKAMLGIRSLQRLLASNLPGHSLSDMHITALEHVQNADETFRKIRDKLYIRLANTKVKGMNKVS